jgi:hypothetical protein
MTAVESLIAPTTSWSTSFVGPAVWRKAPA